MDGPSWALSMLHYGEATFVSGAKYELSFGALTWNRGTDSSVYHARCDGRRVNGKEVVCGLCVNDRSTFLCEADFAIKCITLPGHFGSLIIRPTLNSILDRFS